METMGSYGRIIVTSMYTVYAGQLISKKLWRIHCIVKFIRQAPKHSTENLCPQKFTVEDLEIQMIKDK